MARIKRMSVALVLAVIMVMAFAGTALAFNPPGNSGLSGVECFPATSPAGFNPGGGFVGPWNATDAPPSMHNPAQPIEVGPETDTRTCTLA